MSTVFSMTGFASMSGIAAGGRTLALQVKSVNHRHLDLLIRVPAGLDALESPLRKAVRAAVRRGHVELTCSIEKNTQHVPVRWNKALVEAHIVAFRKVADQFGLKQDPDLNVILRMPDVMSAGPTLDQTEIEEPVLVAAALLLRSFNAIRALEGRALAAELDAGMERLGALTLEARQLREGVADAEYRKLRARIGALVEGQGVSDERLLAEAALLATRSDVEEELVRLKTHIERLRELLSAGGEIGRNLDFMLQEMNREANTLLLKDGRGFWR